MLDAERDYEFVKSFEPEIGSTKTGACFTPDERFLATIGASNSKVNIWQLSSLTKVYDIDLKNSYVHSLSITSNRNYELLVLTCDQKLKAYSLGMEKAKFRGEIRNTHDLFISSVVTLPNLKYLITTGGDKQVSVWDYKMRLNNGKDSSLSFNAHSSPIYTMAVSKHCKRIFTAGGGEGIYEWSHTLDINNYTDTLA